MPKTLKGQMVSTFIWSLPVSILLLFQLLSQPGEITFTLLALYYLRLIIPLAVFCILFGGMKTGRGVEFKFIRLLIASVLWLLAWNFQGEYYEANQYFVFPYWWQGAVLLCFDIISLALVVGLSYFIGRYFHSLRVGRIKKIIVLILLLPVAFLSFLGPNVIDAINLRLFASPEYILNRFYTEQNLFEDQLEDSLILAGSKMAPLLEREILKKEIQRRRYAIGALGFIGNNNSVQILEHILQDKSEIEYFRGDALEAIAGIDLPYAQKIAPQYINDMGYVADRAHEILTDPTSLYKRSYWDALFHRHY